MTWRPLAALGAGVTALLVIAGIASRDRPLTGGAGAGPSPVFFDYAFTTAAIVFVALLVVLVWAVLSDRQGGKPGNRGRWHLLSSFLALAVAAVVAFLILHSGFESRLRRLEGQVNPHNQAAQPQRPPTSTKNVRDARVRWDEIAIVLVLLAGVAVAIVVRRRRLGGPRPLPVQRDEVTAALDESIDDLRNDPNLRRAIIAAYARMERALARGGLPRRPSEAPFEFVERALLGLDASATAAQRLTGLFEWAKFSHHEPDEAMRDEAVDALVAVRDELRASASEPVAA